MVDIQQANQTAVERMMSARPILKGVAPARDVIPGMHDKLLLHAGPPITWDRASGPMRGAIIGGLIFEGLAANEAEAPAAPQTERLNLLRGFNELAPKAFQVPPGEEVLSNGANAAQASFDGGRMDGFLQAQRASDKNEHLSFTAIDPVTGKVWRKIRHHSVVFDRYFSSYMAGSLPNTLSHGRI